MEGTNDEMKQVRDNLILSGHQVSAKHTSDRGHLNYFDIQAMKWAYDRFLKPRRYVTQIVNAQSVDNENLSPQQQDDNFANAVCALDAQMLKDSEIYELLLAACETDDEFRPSQSEEHKRSFQDLQERLGKGEVVPKDSVRYFVEDVLSRVSNDAPFLDGIAREFLVSLNPLYLTDAEVAVVCNTCQGHVTEEARDASTLPELQKLQIQLQKETKLAEDLIAGRYEPTNNIEGEVALMIALDMLSGSVNSQKRDSTLLRREVVAHLSKLETACDDILSPVKTEPGPTRIILQANLFALWGDELWLGDETKQKIAFDTYKQRFCDDYSRSPVPLNNQQRKRWTQLQSAHKLESDCYDDPPPPPPPDAPSPNHGTSNPAKLSLQVRAQAKSSDMGRHGSSPLRSEVTSPNDIPYTGVPGEAGWSSALPSRPQATNRWAERDEGSAGRHPSGAEYSGKV